MWSQRYSCTYLARRLRLNVRDPNGHEVASALTAWHAIVIESAVPCPQVAGEAPMVAAGEGPGEVATSVSENGDGSFTVRRAILALALSFLSDRASVAHV